MAEESILKERMISIINQHIESNPLTNENKKPKKEDEEEWLRAYKSQCKVGEHSKAKMAEILGIKETTFRSKVSRLGKKKIEIAFSGSENCEFFVRLKLKDSENLELNEFSTFIAFPWDSI